MYLDLGSNVVKYNALPVLKIIKNNVGNQTDGYVDLGQKSLRFRSTRILVWTVWLNRGR